MKVRPWLLILFVLLAIVGYFAFTLWAGWENVLDAIEQVGWLGILRTMGLAFLAWVLRFIRWQRFLHALKHDIPWLKSFRIFLSGFAFSLTPGKTGEMVRSVFLKDYHVPYRESFGMFLSERVSDVLSVILIASLGLLTYQEGLPVILFFLCLTLGIIFFASRTKWLRALEDKLKALLPERFSHYPAFLIETVIAFRVCFEPKFMVTGIVLGILAWSLEGYACYLLLNNLGFELPLTTTLFIYAFALLVGAITFLPGGLGGAELTLAHLFLLNSVPPTVTVTVTLLIRLLTLWFSVIVGIIVIPKNIYR